MKMTNLFISLVSALLFACNSQEPTQIEVEVIEPAIQQTEQTVQFEAIPKEVMERFWNEATGIEATVYTNGASFSLWDKGSIQAFIELFLAEAPSQKPSKQIGHIMLLKEGDELALLNIYELDSKAYARYDAEGKTYYSILSGKGADMFLNLQIQQKTE